MSRDAKDGVVNGVGQRHDLDNLFVSDDSQFTTGVLRTPTLNIVSMAIRQSDYIEKQMNERVI